MVRLKSSKMITKKQFKEFSELTDKICKFLNDNFDPHTVIRVDCDSATILQEYAGESKKGKYILD